MSRSDRAFRDRVNGCLRIDAANDPGIGILPAGVLAGVTCEMSRCQESSAARALRWTARMRGGPILVPPARRLSDPRGLACVIGSGRHIVVPG